MTMMTHQIEERIGSARARSVTRSLMAWAMLLAVLFLAIVGALQAGAEVPALNASEPVLLRGEIARGLKIQMTLFRDGSNLYGTYVYEAFGRDIQLKGTITEDGAISLQESFKGKETGRFEGRFTSGDRLEGKWYRPGSDKGRAFFAATTGAPVARQAAKGSPSVPLVPKQVVPSVEPSARENTETARTVKQTPIAAKAEGNVTAGSQALATPVTRRVKQEVAPATREMQLAPSEKKPVAAPAPTEPITVAQQQARAVEIPASAPAQEEVPGAAAPSQELSKKTAGDPPARPVEKARLNGRALSPSDKKSSTSWTDQFLNLRVIAGFGGILVLAIGLGWVAIVAGGSAGFRDSSALFRKVHAMGLSFLPGVFLLALGVGAILTAFVE